MPDDPEPVFRSVISLANDSYYTLYIGGVRDDIESDFLEIDTQPVAQRTNITFINAADIVEVVDEETEEALSVNIYLLAVGESLGGVSPQITSVGFMDARTVSIAKSPLLVVATETGATDNILAGPEPVLPEQNYPIVVIREAAGGGLPININTEGF
ncbi:MAG: hypothetical protein AAF525_22270 [Pseudomonadota bacterium]